MSMSLQGIFEIINELHIRNNGPGSNSIVQSKHFPLSYDRLISLATFQGLRFTLTCEYRVVAILT